MIVLITGSSKGIGRSLAEHYCACGHQVFGLSRGASSCAFANYRHFTADVTDAASLAPVRAAIRKECGRLDALLNNAGAARMNHFALTPTATARELMEINYLGAFTCTGEFLGLLKKSEHPRVVNFTTVAVPLGLEGELAYASAKAAVESFTKIAAKELGAFNITVNAVGPGPLPTELTRSVPEERLRALEGRQAVKRAGTFADVAHVTDFFLSPAADAISGQIIYLGGVSA